MGGGSGLYTNSYTPFKIPIHLLYTIHGLWSDPHAIPPWAYRHGGRADPPSRKQINTSPNQGKGTRQPPMRRQAVLQRDGLLRRSQVLSVPVQSDEVRQGWRWCAMRVVVQVS